MNLDGRMATVKTPETQGRGASEGKGWSTPEEQRLYEAFSGLKDFADLSARHARTRSAIRSRLIVLGLLSGEGQVILPKPPFRPSKASLTRAVLQIERGFRCDDASHAAAAALYAASPRTAGSRLSVRPRSLWPTSTICRRPRIPGAVGYSRFMRESRYTHCGYCETD